MISGPSCPRPLRPSRRWRKGLIIGVFNTRGLRLYNSDPDATKWKGSTDPLNLIKVLSDSHFDILGLTETHILSKADRTDLIARKPMR